MFGHNRETDRRDVHQFTQAQQSPVRDFTGAVMHKDSILCLERHNVSHGPESHQVEPSAQVEAWEGASFEQSMAKFENDSNATKVTESGILDGLRVYDRNAVG